MTESTLTMWRTQLELTAKDERTITFRVIPRPEGDDEVVLPRDEVPQWAWSRPVGWRGYAKASVGAETAAEIRLADWEEDQPDLKLWVVAFTLIVPGYPGQDDYQHRTMLVPTDNTHVAHTPQAAHALFTQWLGSHIGARVFGPYNDMRSAAAVQAQPWLFQLDDHRQYVHQGGQLLAVNGEPVLLASQVLGEHT